MGAANLVARERAMHDLRALIWLVSCLFSAIRTPSIERLLALPRRPARREGCDCGGICVAPSDELRPSEAF